MTTFVRGLLYLQLYLVVTIAPLLFALVGDRPAGRSFWIDLSAALGFVGLALLGLQFAVTARAKRLAAPFGQDVVVTFHRRMSVVAFVLILAHPVMLFVARPETLELLNVLDAPWRARFAVLATVSLIALVVTSLWRTRLGLSYEVWKVLHGVLAVIIVGAALVHVYLVDYYVATVWKQVLWALMTLGLVAILGWTRLVGPLLQFRRPWRVTEVREERGNAYTLRLEPDGHGGIKFQPGQFVWLRVNDGPFSPEEHPFSISSSAELPDGVIECTIKDLGDWTSQVHRIQPGAVAYVDGPYGVFTPDRAEGPSYLMVAGGIGITPIMSALRTMADRDDRRTVTLLYGDRSWGDMAFREELEQLAGVLSLRFVAVVESPPETTPEAVEMETGRIDEELIDRYLPESPAARRRQQYLICGPPAMTSVVEHHLRELGVPLDRIHHEQFAFA
ncbi:MAG: ferric reductase-like transmembrane domain-containing protein [Acidimicrobiia bacterium]|nr:ferric reductase-like transmembrane domain-containing protein [Acidimicrobiia bacterium]